MTELFLHVIDRDRPITITQRQLEIALTRRAKRLRKGRSIFINQDEIPALAHQSACQLLDDLKQAAKGM